jgi:integrase/recombinase XerD
MLTIYRRHTKRCEHRLEGRTYRRCRCPIWIDGMIGGKEIRQGLNTRDWQRANDTLQKWEAQNEAVQELPAQEPMTVSLAWIRFIADAKARGLREPTIRKYEHLNWQLEKYAEGRGLRYLAELDVDALTDFRATWPNRNLSALKKLELLRTFFRFCEDRSWITDNPARKIKNPKVTEQPTLPFTREEQMRILSAIEALKHSPSRKDRRVRALILLLRYTGLRISDAATLSRERVAGGRLFLYTSKAGTPVYCPLPDFVTEALNAVISPHETFFFWTGHSKPKTVISHWQIELQEFFAKAEVAHGHAHRFRDTFAVELLLAGVPIERVSVLLGHRGIRVTERHYAPWVRARQEQLESDVRRSWGIRLDVEPRTKGTPEVHGTRRVF